MSFEAWWSYGAGCEDLLVVSPSVRAGDAEVVRNLVPRKSTAEVAVGGVRLVVYWKTSFGTVVVRTFVGLPLQV